jgi:tRNA (cytidine/uridine-2'-O-)-methyltransferase
VTRASPFTRVHSFHSAMLLCRLPVLATAANPKCPCRRLVTATAGRRGIPAPSSTPPWTPPADPATAHAWHRTDLALVLVHPAIPHNTGATARTCAAAGVPLHIVGPIGFSLADKGLRRAGLDYWASVAVCFHEDWGAFMASMGEGGREGRARLVAFSKLGTVHHATEGLYAPPGGGAGRTFLLFGAETTGLPPEAHVAADAVVRIPIVTREVRSLNLAVSAGVGLFEAVRQLDGAVLV